MSKSNGNGTKKDKKKAKKAAKKAQQQLEAAVSLATAGTPATLSQGECQTAPLVTQGAGRTRPQDESEGVRGGTGDAPGRVGQASRVGKSHRRQGLRPV